MEEVIEGKDFCFPKEEEKVLGLWERLDAFKEQLRRTEGQPEYIFYDGPPFATGLPHHGHILAGTIKVGGDTTRKTSFAKKINGTTMHACRPAAAVPASHVRC